MKTTVSSNEVKVSLVRDDNGRFYNHLSVEKSLNDEFAIWADFRTSVSRDDLIDFVDRVNELLEG